ncbi:MAG: 50S ribosomal protein L15 [Calditrichaeota bacterium]|nr:50S ribosomal protein L15 [Calditrichota bacterium]
MNLSQLKPPAGSKKQRKRLGRGDASGHGGTSTRGHKGQHSRSGAKHRAWFEGGQMPLQRRVPKRGFTSPFKKEYQVVNLSDLERLEAVTTVDPAVLREKGLIKKKGLPVKILGSGQLTRALQVSAHAFSKSAKEKIESAGGKVTVL